MKTTDNLEREHEWIEHMANSLEALIARTKADERLPEEAQELLFLFETFADGRHQDKEEQVLFPELLDVATEPDRASLGQLLKDHECERRYMAGMRLNLLGAVHGEPGCVRAFVKEAGEYMDLHRAHMMREEQILLPMAKRLLTREADARVVLGFERIDGGADDPHGVEEQVLSLLHRVGLPMPPAA